MLSEATKPKDEGETASKVQRSCGLQPCGRHWTWTAAKGLAIATASDEENRNGLIKVISKTYNFRAVLSKPQS